MKFAYLPARGIILQVKIVKDNFQYHITWNRNWIITVHAVLIAVWISRACQGIVYNWTTHITYDMQFSNHLISFITLYCLFNLELRLLLLNCANCCEWEGIPKFISILSLYYWKKIFSYNKQRRRKWVIWSFSVPVAAFLFNWIKNIKDWLFSPTKALFLTKSFKLCHVLLDGILLFPVTPLMVEKGRL